MHLKRVRIPNFRALKDVDITFESDFFPKIFPLGSVNGGGKSTLLQFIFILFHCTPLAQRIKAVKNLFERDIEQYVESSTSLISSFEIFDEQNKTITLDFLLLDIEKFVKNQNNSNTHLWLDNDREWDSEKIDSFKSLMMRLTNFDEEIIQKKISNMKFQIELEEKTLEIETEHDIRHEASIFINDLNSRIDIARDRLENSEKEIKNINQELSPYKIYGLCSVINRNNPEESKFLVCQYDGITNVSPNNFFESLSQKTFLVAPSTQIFLFLPPSIRKDLFKNSSSEGRDAYQQALKQSKSDLENFYADDFFSVDLILNAFKKARNLDFAEKVKSGHYGQNYDKLFNELNILLSGKQVKVEPDLSGIKFVIEGEEEPIELYPEDLSHGELKRLNLYLWLKFNNIKDSIVLIDEIEIALHPDWQYQIVRDLEEWEPSNQYILATHSYELCQALTPAHVKELEPRLMQSNSEAVQPHY